MRNNREEMAERKWHWMVRRGITPSHPPLPTSTLSLIFEERWHKSRFGKLLSRTREKLEGGILYSVIFSKPTAAAWEGMWSLESPQQTKQCQPPPFFQFLHLFANRLQNSGAVNGKYGNKVLQNYNMCHKISTVWIWIVWTLCKNIGIFLSLESGWVGEKPKLFNVDLRTYRLYAGFR